MKISYLFTRSCWGEAFPYLVKTFPQSQLILIREYPQNSITYILQYFSNFFPDFIYLDPFHPLPRHLFPNIHIKGNSVDEMVIFHSKSIVILQLQVC